MATPSTRAVGAQNFFTGGVPGTPQNLTLTRPTYQEDDIIIAIITGDTAATDIPSCTPPSGWAAIHTPGSGLALQSGGRLFAFWLRAGGSEPATYNFSCDGTGGPSFRFQGFLVTVQDCKTSGNPWDARVEHTDSTPDTTLSWGTMNPTKAPSLLYGIGGGSSSFTPFPMTLDTDWDTQQATMRNTGFLEWGVLHDAVWSDTSSPVLFDTMANANTDAGILINLIGGGLDQWAWGESFDSWQLIT